MDAIPAKLFDRTADYHQRRWLIELPPDVSYEDLFAPEFWRLAAAKLSRLDEICVLGGKDSTLDCTLRVTAVGAGYAVCRLIHRVVHEVPESDVQTPEYAFVPGRRWCRLAADGSIVAGGFASRAEAEAAQ